MKKLIIVLLCFVFILQFIAASDIVYLTKTASGDSVILDSISEKGYSADIVNIDDINSVNFEDYKMILLGNELLTSTEAKKIPINTENSVVLNTRNLKEWGWTSDGISSTTPSSPLRLPVWDKESSLVSGIGDDFLSYVNNGFNFLNYRFYYLSNRKKPAGMNTVVADGVVFRLLTQKYVIKNGAVVATLKPGVLLKNGKTSQARGVFFGLTNTELWTEDTETIFKNSLDWAIKGEDRDNDGFYMDEDCDDTNEDINPGAVEIPYNYIDENCDGKDLADVDSDKYCKAGYVIMDKTLQCDKETGSVGTDCNDNDGTYNPDSSDLKKNCRNDAPVFSGSIPDQIWNEDETSEINLSLYFSDPDGDSLVYGIYDTSEDENITLFFLAKGILRFESPANWSGSDWVILNASDAGELSALSNQITLTVNPVNDAPILENIPNIIAVEGQIVEITSTATDTEEGILIYSINDTRFQKDNNIFRWQTEVGNAGSYIFKISVEDNKGAVSSKNVSVNIMPKSLINEFVSNPSEGNDWVELYNPGNQIVDLSECELKDGAANILELYGIIPAKGFLAFNWSDNLNNAGDTIELYCNAQLTDKVTYGNGDDNSPIPGVGESAGRDPDGKDTNIDVDDFKIFSHPTRELPNNADVVVPVTTLISPGNGTNFTDTRDIEVNFTATDDKDENIECYVYLNNALSDSLTINNGAIGSFLLDNLIDGSYIWNVKCSDGTNYAYAQDNWIFYISAPDNPVLNPIGAKTINENQTLTFGISATDSDGDIIILTAENLPEGAVFTDYTNRTGSFSWIPTYEKAGEYNIKFTAKDATGLEDSETVKITVKNIKAPPKFSDINLCEEINSNLSITIQDPDDGDDFMIGELIKGEAEVENNADEDMDVDLEIYLYDISEEDVIEKVSESIDVDDGDSEKVEFEIEIPEDADEGDEFALFVKAEEDGIDYCSQKYIKLNIEREEHSVIIDEFTLNPEVTEQGKSVSMIVKIKNIGEEDEDVYVTVENKELNLSGKSEEFEIENYWDNNEETTEFSFKVPQNSEKKSYEIAATVFFDDGHEKNSKSGNLTVSEKRKEFLTLPLLPLNEENATGIRARLISLTGSATEEGNKPRIVLAEEPRYEKPAKGFLESLSGLDHPLTLEEYLISIDIALAVGILLETLLIVLIKTRRIGIFRRIKFYK